MSVDIREKIVGYLSQHIPVSDLAATDDIFERGFVSSMFAMQLVVFLEREFALEVDDDDLELDNFRSIDGLTGFVERKLAVVEAG